MKTRGFSLIEAVLALSLLAAGLIGLLYIFQDAVANSLVADQTYVATNIARETMDKVISQRDCNETGCGYSNTLTSINSNTYSASPVSGFSNYSVITTALEVNPDDDDAVDDFADASPGSGYARVTVQVTWNNGTNSIQLVTLLADYTL